MSLNVLNQEFQMHYTMGRGEVGISVQSSGVRNAIEKVEENSK